MADSTHHEIEMDLIALFRKHGVACTAQRMAIWQYFAGQPRGHTISDAVEALQQAHISQATVYRTVLLFLEMGLLCRIQDETTNKDRYVPVHPGHSHPLVCRSCHEIVEFDSCDLSLLERLLARETGYAIERHHLEIYGLCPSCQTQPMPSLAHLSANH